MAPRTPTIYYFLKVNKSPTCPPGHPIVSGIDSVTSQVGRYIDYYLQPYLQPLVQKMPLYIKDTRHTINLLSNHRPKPGLWKMTTDVSSLYTVIPHNLGLAAVND